MTKSQLLEKQSEETKNFLADVHFTMNKMVHDFEEHHSLFKTATEHVDTLNALGERFSEMSFNELKFVLLSLQKHDEGETVCSFFIDFLADSIPDAYFNLLAEDERLTKLF